MHRTYVLTDDDIEGEINTAFVEKIFKSKLRRAKMKFNPNVKYSKFFRIFFAEAYQQIQLEEILLDSVDLLMHLVENCEIPDDDYSKGVSYFLLASQLAAYCEYYRIESGEKEGEIGAAAEFCIDNAMKFIQSGLEFKMFGPKIAVEFCKVMEEKHDILINEEGHIIKYFYLLQIDVSQIFLIFYCHLTHSCFRTMI
jgi:hypothetical protein